MMRANIFYALLLEYPRTRLRLLSEEVAQARRELVELGLMEDGTQPKLTASGYVAHYLITNSARNRKFYRSPDILAEFLWRFAPGQTIEKAAERERLVQEALKLLLDRGLIAKDPDDLKELAYRWVA